MPVLGRLGHVDGWVVPPVAPVRSQQCHRGLDVKDDQGDARIFVWAGRTLLSGQWSHALSHAIVQAGPLQLALFGSLGRSSGALALVLAPATALLVVVAASRGRSDEPQLPTEEQACSPSRRA